MNPFTRLVERVSPRQLEYLLAVVEAQGVAAAARRLGVAPATISRSLHSLEHRLDATLLEPMSRPPRLTQQGEIAVQMARRALQFLDAIPREVGAVEALEGGVLTVMTLPSLAERVVARAALRFRAEHPGVALRITAPERPVPHYLDLAVESGAADLAVTELTYRPERLAVVDLGMDEYVGMLPPGTAVPSSGVMPLGEFLEHGLVVGPYWANSAAARRVRALHPELDSLTIARTDFRDMVVHLVLTGLGCGLATDQATLARSLGAEIVTLRPAVQRRIGVLYRPQHFSTAARAFADLLQQG
ncbi:LysR family transcriptional regulator [Saccharopolyspora shandongensis]|uniref:LysR family transcriptional regulator n=1 Tax=Saccharopolyspora shandongensis TaxID=418495 RepID=UPI0034260354